MKETDGWTILANYAAKRAVKIFLKRWLLKKVIANSSHLFLRGQDKISIQPLIGETYEPELQSFIEYAVKMGFSDYLFDIGANIGLITCHAGHNFKTIYCYEPNPMLYKVLEANLMLAEIAERAKVKTFGIGATEGEFLVSMPFNNLGAGFIQNQDNTYTPTVLARKDNNPTTDFSDYLHQKVTIKSAKLAFRENFQELGAHGHSKGIVKIDIEGMELTVIREFIKSIPRGFHAMIVFENHDSSAQFTQIIEEVLRVGTHQISFAKIQILTPYKVKNNRIVKGIRAFFGNSSIILKNVSSEFVPVGTVVINLIPRS